MEKTAKRERERERERERAVDKKGERKREVVMGGQYGKI